MGLFSRKKPEEKQELPPLKFPEFSTNEQAGYESTITPQEEMLVKKPVNVQQSNMPLRKPVMPRTEEKERGFMDFERQRMERPKMRVEEREFRPAERERVVYIKIDRYQDIITKIEEVKSKVSEAERVLRRLYETKAEEERELKLWQEDFNKVKETLKIVDHVLFGQ